MPAETELFPSTVALVDLEDNQGGNRKFKRNYWQAKLFLL